MSAAIQLRDYQTLAVERIERRFADGRRGVVLVLPCRGGKTATASEVVWREVAGGGRVLWLAHRTELIGQAHRALERAGLRCGVIAASSDLAADPSAPVQVGSIQTLLARGTDALEPTLIVYDECHIAAAETWSTLLTRWPNAKRLGLTATPARADGIGLGGLFEVIVVGSTILQLTSQGWLVPLDIIQPGRALPSGQIAQRPVAALQQHAPTKQAIVFAPNVKTAIEMAGEFTAAGIASDVVHGEQTPERRAGALAAYESKRTQVLCSVAVLAVGWDSPQSSVAIVARRVGSPGLWIQMTSRILGAHESKARALLIDLAGSVHLPGIGRPDAEREYSLDGQGIRAAGETVAGSFCPVCGALMTDDPTCAECAFVRTPRDLRVVNAPLKLLAADYCAADSPSQIVERLARWIVVAETKQHKPSSVFYKFKGIYKRPPSSVEIQAAKALAVRLRAPQRGAA